MKTREEVLKEKYGFNKASYNYITPGAEILKYIGQPVVLVEFKRKEDGTWENGFRQAILDEVDGFNPLTMVYTAKYHTDNSEQKTIEVIPEGFSFGNPEETGEMIRFVPLSLHYKMAEDEMFYNRLAKIFEERDTISIDGLKNLSESKEKEKTLKYCCNIGAVIKLHDGSILYTRVHDLRLKHRQGNSYSLYIENENNHASLLITSEMKSYDFEGIGELKLLDLRGE